MCFMERATLTTAAVEEWRPIEGWEGLYEVSNMGRVRSLDRYIDIVNDQWKPTQRFCRGRVLKQTMNIYGYMLITLHKDRTVVTKLVNRLVAQAFIPNPNNLPETNHKDQNPANNRADNLEWCDRIYNLSYADCREKHNRSISRLIEQLTIDGRHVAYHLGIKSMCAETKMCRHRIQGCLTNRKGYKTAYGYQWRYVNNNT